MTVYKPDMRRTCCPTYTIRLEADSFSPSKDQARVLHRMQRYLDGTYQGPQTVGRLQKDGCKSTSERSGEVTSDGSPATPLGKNHSSNVVPRPANMKQNSVKKRQSDVLDEAGQKLSLAIQCSIAGCVELGLLPPDFNQQEVTVRKFTDKARGKLKDLDGHVEYTSNVAFVIAAAMKHKQSHIVQVDQEASSVDNNTSLSTEEWSPECVAEILVSRLQHGNLQGLIPQACKGHLNFLLSEGKVRIDTSSPKGETTSKGHALKIYPSEPKKQPLQEARGQKRGAQKLVVAPLPSVKTRRMDIQMRKSAFDAEEFALYKKYQILVHNDKPEQVNESTYCSFLIDTPLISVPPASDGTTPADGFGSFHQQYRIDGKLVAVGVVDILPHCLSSKYLFWDPDLPFLSLGKYSALKEIEWVQEAHKVCPSLKYYYLGYYIHSCPKMRYKAAYAPSELLCPVKYTWVPYHLVRSHLDRSPYFCLSDVLASEGLPLPNGMEADSEDEIEVDDMTTTTFECASESEEEIEVDKMIAQTVE
ncbi:hypothetical protein CY35_18G087300 [Sphagnum magellanicum]|jgi:arginine-tRNA-protein transferase|nr:hypothetical protein CY35_18G087300 [Sphagnum magellanicum]